MKQLNFFETNKGTWLKLAREVAKQHAREHGEVSADDIHRLLPTPNFLDGRIMGSVFQGMKFIRYKKSEREKCHHRVIGVFTEPKAEAA